LTPTQEKELIEMLESKRNELTQKLRMRRTGATSEQTPGDEADLASEDAEVSLETRLMDRDAKLLREVERALEKVADGLYGLCEGTDEPIGYARLKLRPWTRYSVTYKEELEREEKRMGGAE
jgi:DnaK suppressor protein